jgi:hypothetical protein
MIVKDMLDNLGIKTYRNGDDLYFPKPNVNGKLTVSIATCSVSSMKIHFALNLVESGTPDNIETAGLLEPYMGIGMSEIQKFIDDVCETYINEILSIKMDITKTKVF